MENRIGLLDLRFPPVWKLGLVFFVYGSNGVFTPYDPSFYGILGGAYILLILGVGVGKIVSYTADYTQ